MVQFLEGGTYTETETYTDDKSWEWRKYAKGATVPVLANYGDDVAYTQLKTYTDASTSLTMNIADSYTARCTTWVYFSTATSKSITVNSDDASTWYLDGTLISTCSAYNDAKTATWNFPAGWSKVQCVYTEGSGGDGWVMSPKLNTFAEKMASSYSKSPAVASITSTANPGYSLRGWYDQNGICVSTDANPTVTLTENTTLFAYFGGVCTLL